MKTTANLYELDAVCASGKPLKKEFFICDRSLGFDIPLQYFEIIIQNAITVKTVHSRVAL